MRVTLVKYDARMCRTSTLDSSIISCSRLTGEEPLLPGAPVPRPSCTNEDSSMSTVTVSGTPGTG